MFNFRNKELKEALDQGVGIERARRGEAIRELESRVEMLRKKFDEVENIPEDLKSAWF